MKIAMPSLQKKTREQKEVDRLFFIMEYLWHTMYPMVILLCAIKMSYFFLILLLFSFLRIRKDWKQKNETKKKTLQSKI